VRPTGRGHDGVQTCPTTTPNGRAGSGRLRIAVLLKTNSGGMWILPQVDELRSRGHEVVVILPPGPGRLTVELQRRGVEVIASPFTFTLKPSGLRALIRLRGLIRQLRPDVLQYHLIASAYVARLTTIGLPLRRVYMVAGPAYLKSRLISAAERLLWRLDDIIICGCEFASELYAGLGCPPPRRPVATYGVNTDHFRPDWTQVVPSTRQPDEGRVDRRAKARAELGIPQDAFLVVMVAYVYAPKRLVHRGRGIKGHDILLAAWQEFRRRCPQAHLLMVGSGWTPAGEAQRQQIIERFGINRDPSITWFATVPDVRPCYSAADVSVSPSLCESHGAAVEAGAMAVPNIVSDAGGLPETVDQSSGWVVRREDPEALRDALERAYREFEAGMLVERGGAARRRMVDLFDSRRSAARVADIVEDSVSAGSRR
jgi:glycosyltransferase involved in cell wall biosynthesis